MKVTRMAFAYEATSLQQKTTGIGNSTFKAWKVSTQLKPCLITRKHLFSTKTNVTVLEGPSCLPGLALLKHFLTHFFQPQPWKRSESSRALGLIFSEDCKLSLPLFCGLAVSQNGDILRRLDSAYGD